MEITVTQFKAQCLEIIEKVQMEICFPPGNLGMPKIALESCRLEGFHGDPADRLIA